MLKIKNKRKFLRYAIIIGVACIIVLTIAKKKGWIGKDTEVKVSTELAEKRSIIESVSANGRIQPETEVKISPDVSGEVVELLIKEGDKVKKGDLLAKINPEIYISNLDRLIASVNTQKASLANAKARLAQAKAQFINAEISFKRNEKLWKQQVISDSEYDNAESAFKVAKAEVDAAEQSVKAAQYTVVSAEASVKEARENLTKTSIFSPIDGTISLLSIEKGERVVGTSQFAGTEIMRIADLTVMEANVSVNENDIVRVKLNDTALIEVDAYLNRKFKGVVTEIANSADITGVSADQITNFNVKIRVLQDSYKDLISPEHPNLSPFRPGMSTTVDIQTSAVNDVLTIPIQAVTARNDSANKTQVRADKEKSKAGTDAKEVNKNEKSQEFVFIYKSGKVILQKVKTGIQDNRNIQILEGLKEGDEVVIGPYSAVTKTLKDGDQVKKVDKKDLFQDTKKKK